ncbi:signal peptidase II [Amycolatopsis sp. CA-230715]|uniref:signal peptidase II n=1 Tax=Amycolatopsis sp. CA-230715 TaxID=2745196 RepID=UPI001C20C7B4|nr:signal peptidase II [Amycolatopsis sp. CA-230715]
MAEAEPDIPATQPKRRVALVAAVAVAALAADVLTKVLALSAWEGREPVRALGGLVYFQIVRNPGAAFSLATGMTWILAIGAVVVAGAIIWLSRRLRSAGWAIGLGLVLAGALGNLTDRLFRAPGPLQGHVIDFISLFSPNGETWPVFNVADSCICVGAALIVVLSLRGKDYDGTSSRSRKAAKA